jgi:uncharacterized membrane protein
MSINSNEGQNPDQSNSYSGYGGYSGGYQAPSSAQQPYDPNDPYADRSEQGTYTGYDQQQSSSDQQQQEQMFYQPPESATRRQRTQTSSSASSMKMSPNRAAIFSYALGWVSGLVFLVMERKNSFVRFSAAQSFILFGGVTILQVILRAIGAIPFLGTILLSPILGLVGTVITVAALAAWLFLMFQAYRGVKVKIPIVGDYAEALVARLTR